MRRLLSYILLLFCLIPLMAQRTQISLPNNGEWPEFIDDSIMLIGPTQETLSEKQMYFNPVYLITHPSKEHLKTQLIRACACDCDTNVPNRRIGVFSVSDDKKVSFSQGNLQYLPAANIWRFADNQYDYCGNANKFISPTFRNWVDLFGWSANNITAPFGISTSTNAADYAGDFVDWGTNTICGDKPGTWRTLSKEEWEYLLNGRDNANKLQCRAQVNNVNGFVFLPDQWLCPEGIELKIEPLTTQVFTFDAWSKMENAGAVFLPAAGRLNNKQLVNFDDHGNYWSSTRIDNTNVDYFAFTFSTNKLHVDHQSPIHLARSVRLVHDTIVPEAVDLGLSVKWATFNVGATSPEDYGDYFAWGETETKEEYNWATYKWCNGTGRTMTKYCTNSEYGANGFTDNKTILEPADDAARVHWGGYWRMPTKEEIEELREKCTWTWTTLNGVNGYEVVSPNNESIFLPVTGYKRATNDYSNASSGFYWSNTLSTDKDDDASKLNFSSNGTFTRDGIRYDGNTIRPVYDDRPPKRIGVFSVAADKQVSFSQGNLQYIQSTDTWQFANNQLEYMGHKHYRNGQLADTIEYFGWSGKNSKAPWGISLSTELTDYKGEFLDWGTNIIAGDLANTWRTLSNDEWNYICQGRKNAANLLGFGKIDTISGLIILPDDWVAPDGITFTPNIDNPNSNPYNLQQWTAMENAGAVFIPPTGYFNHKMDNMRAVHQYGYYRTSTLAQDGRQIFSRFSIIEDGLSNGLSGRIVYSYSGNNQGNLFYAFPVRLVHDTIVTQTIPDPCLVVKVNDTLSINMMCVEGGTFRMGDDSKTNSAPAHQVTLSNYYIGQTEITQELWKAVMGSNPSKFSGNLRPVESVSWEECQVFVQKLSEMTGLRFRLPTEAEWEYAAKGGHRSKGYTFAGSDDINEVAWYGDNADNQTHTIASKLPNELGIFDMTGNVWEWCYDWHAPYSAEAQTNPQGATTGEKRVLRGGCYHYTSSACTNTNRHSYYPPDKGGASTGLRLVLEVE